LLNDINRLDVILAKARGPDFRESRELAPFYPLPPALGKRAGMALLQGARQIRVICGGRAAVWGV